MFFESFLLNLTVLGALIVALIFDYATKYFSYWYIRNVPYRTPIPFFGTDYYRILGIRNTSEEVNKLYKSYPKEKYIGCIKSRIPDLIIKDPNSIEKVLSTDFSNFHCRGYGLDRSRDVCLRNNLFYAEKEKWALCRRRLELLLSNMTCDIENSVHDCLSGTNGDANAQELLSDILDVVFKDFLIDNKLEDPSIVKNMRETMQKRTFFEILKSYLKNIFPSLYVMLGLNVLSGQYLSKFAQVVEGSKLMKDIKKDDLISQEEIRVNKISEKKSDLDLAYSHMALFIGEGYLPCHGVLVSLLFELAKNPEVQKNVRRCFHQPSGNDYLQMAIKETLRLYPAYSVISRQCVKSYQFLDKDLPLDKNVTVNIPVEAIQRDEKFYKDANVFNPDRFFNNEFNFTYLAFGVGPRKCIGEQLALNIIRTVTTDILKKFEIEPCDKTPEKLKLTDHNFQRIIVNDVWLRFKPIS